MAPKGATCISVYKERPPGWYRWNRTLGRETTYTYIDDGIVAVRWAGVVEFMGVLPHNYEDYNWVDFEDETLDIMTDDFIIEHVEQNDMYGP